MSIKSNPTVIGIFVLGAMAVAVAGIILVGSVKMFSENEEYIIYFDESVSGLDIGSQVKFRGVPMGQVKDIYIRYNQIELSAHIPVLIEIEVSRLANKLGITVDITDDEEFFAQVSDGLRAQLVMESFITGLYYIDLSFIENAPPPNFIQEKIIYKEIPSVKSPFAEIGQSATEIIARLSTIDIEKINNKLVSLLESANDAIDDVNFKNISDSLIDATESIAELVNSENVQAVLGNLKSALAEIRKLSVKIEENIDPVLAGANGTNQEVQKTLISLRNTADRIEEALTPESSIRYEVERALSEMSAAAQSIQQLSDYLERNPRSLLTGKKMSEKSE
jgi:paraquat-inducible protein B